MSAVWQLLPAALREDDDALAAEVRRVYREIHQRDFLHDPALNDSLPVETRALRHIEHWRALLLLTPWMLARLLIPGSTPALLLPAGWCSESVVLGPILNFTMMGAPQKGHLNYDPLLGHYLIQPLIMAMESYGSPAEVYAAWNAVLNTRDENMRRMQRDCPWQREVSRRELFTGSTSAAGG